MIHFPTILPTEILLRRKSREIADEVLQERYRQNVKFAGSTIGEQRHNVLTWACVLGEESGESQQAALDIVFGKTPTDFTHLREELVQTAAVAFAMIERIDARDGALIAPEGTYKNG